MEISIKVCSNKEREADKEPTIFHKVKFIKGNGIMVKLRVLEYVSGQMEDIMKVIGQIIKKMDMGYSDGQMEDSIMEIIEMIKNRAREHIYGSMVENTQDSGKTINVMAKVNM